MKDKYKAAVVGCGNIGGFLDYPGDKKIVTHAHAYKAHGKFELASCCDIRQKALMDFKSRWGKGIRCLKISMSF